MSRPNGYRTTNIAWKHLSVEAITEDLLDGRLAFTLHAPGNYIANRIIGWIALDIIDLSTIPKHDRSVSAKSRQGKNKDVLRVALELKWWKKTKKDPSKASIAIPIDPSIAACKAVLTLALEALAEHFRAIGLAHEDKNVRALINAKARDLQIGLAPQKQHGSTFMYVFRVFKKEKELAL